MPIDSFLTTVTNHAFNLCFTGTFLTSAFNFTLDALKVILVLGFLIFIHELGHFIAAKKADIKVHEFALGFGPKLFSKVKGETTYSLRLIPMGGFVRMEGEEEASDDERSFGKKSIIRRLIVVFAGPLMNIIFTILILIGFVMYSGHYTTNVIQTVVPGSGAELAGLQAGDKVTKINNTSTRIWDDINWTMIKQGKSKMTVEYIRDKKYTKEINARMQLTFTVNDNNKITAVDPDMGIDKLGVKPDLIIKAINGISVNTPKDIEAIIARDDSKNYIFTLASDDGKISEKSINSMMVRRYYIGISPVQKIGNAWQLLDYSYWKSMFMIKIMVEGVADLITHKVEVKDMMGPVGIITEISNQKALADLIWFTAFISLNLGIINLVPFPPLDGGKILTLTIEAVRRKPLKPEFEATLSMIGFSLLMLLMLVVTYNDIVRSIFG